MLRKQETEGFPKPLMICLIHAWCPSSDPTTLPGSLGRGGQKVRREGGEEGHFLVNG